MEKIINRLIDEAVVNVDKYINNNSTWLIFTETKQWVIELTKDGTLWYNYNFFKNLFVYMSMDVVENQHYITKWVEDTIISGVKSIKGEYYKEIQKVEYTIQNGVKEIELHKGVRPSSVEDTIINGVKHTIDTTHHKNKYVEDAIKNGVKETHSGCDLLVDDYIEDAIQNGVKDTRWMSDWVDNKVEDTIENGVKETKLGAPDNRDYFIYDTIENGVKHTKKSLQIDGSCVVEDVLKNGVKETIPGGYLGSITMGGKLVHMVESPNQNNEVEDVIQHGVIETFDETHHRRREVVRTIRDGIKETIL